MHNANVMMSIVYIASAIIIRGGRVIGHEPTALHRGDNDDDEDDDDNGNDNEVGPIACPDSLRHLGLAVYFVLFQMAPPGE